MTRDVTHLALLRAVNLAGRNTVSMAALREVATGVGLTNAQTLLQSGNLLFTSAAKAPELERLLAGAVAAELGVRTEFFVRSVSEWRQLIAANPFPREAKGDPGHLLVVFLKQAPRRPQLDALRSAIVGAEIVAAARRQAYVVYPDGVGRSRLTLALIERHLGCAATGRNWNTVLKLGALAGL